MKSTETEVEYRQSSTGHWIIQIPKLDRIAAVMHMCDVYTMSCCENLNNNIRIID